MGTLLVFILAFCVLVALGSGLMSAWTDFKGLLISNIYPVLIVIAFVLAWPAYHFLAPPEALYFGSLKTHLISGGLMFVVTFILFSLGWFGAGDSKLASAYALWVGMTGMPAFLFYTTLVGGILGVAALLIKKYKPFKDPAEQSWIAKTQSGQSAVPYGIAIFFGALVAFIQNGYVSLDRLASLVSGS